MDYGVSAWELRRVLLLDVVGASTVNARNHSCPASQCGQASTRPAVISRVQRRTTVPHWHRQTRSRPPARYCREQTVSVPIVSPGWGLEERESITPSD